MATTRRYRMKTIGGQSHYNTEITADITILIQRTKALGLFLIHSTMAQRQSCSWDATPYVEIIILIAVIYLANYVNL